MWTFHGDGTFTPGLALHVSDLPFPIEYAIVIVDNSDPRASGCDHRSSRLTCDAFTSVAHQARGAS